MLAGSDRINRKPLHAMAVLSATLYDCVFIEVVCMSDVLDHAGKQSAGVTDRIKRVAETTPYKFVVLNPRACHPVYDDYGLYEWHKSTSVRVGTLIDTYENGKELFEKTAKNGKIDRNATVVVRDFWDPTERYVWADGLAAPFIGEPHGMRFIPIADQIAEGSDLFDDPHNQYEPFLRTVFMSGLDQRKTEALTALYTMNRAYGYSPLHIFEAGENDQEVPAIKRMGLFGYVSVPKGGKWGPLLNKGIQDPAASFGLAYADEKTEDSTMYKSTYGASLGAKTPYSTVALLSQIGRLPLETIRTGSGRAIAKALEIAFMWIKDGGKKQKIFDYRTGALSELDTAELPEHFNLDVELDVALPQDRLQAATTGASLLSAGVVSKNWVRTKLLNINQPEEIEQEIYDEQWVETFSRVRQDLKAQEMAMQQQQAMQPPQPPMEAQPPIPMEGEQAMQAAVQNPMGTDPNMGGMPIEAMLGGMQGPEQLGMDGMIPEMQ